MAAYHRFQQINNHHVVLSVWHHSIVGDIDPDIVRTPQLRGINYTVASQSARCSESIRMNMQLAWRCTRTHFAPDKYPGCRVDRAR